MVLLSSALSFLKLFNSLQSKLASLSTGRPIMSIPPTPYRIQSINTKTFVISNFSDKPCQEVVNPAGISFLTIPYYVPDVPF